MKHTDHSKHLETNTIKQALADQAIAQALHPNDSFLIHKELFKFFGINKAIYISNLIDNFVYLKSINMLREDESFFVTFKQQTKQTGLSEYQLRQCKKYFINLGILDTKMSGAPAKEYYFIYLDQEEDG